MPFGDVRSDVKRLYRTVCIVRLRRWFVVLELDVRRSESIFWKSRVLNDLLGVDVRMGNKAWSSLILIKISKCTD